VHIADDMTAYLSTGVRAAALPAVHGARCFYYAMVIAVGSGRRAPKDGRAIFGTDWRRWLLTASSADNIRCCV